MAQRKRSFVDAFLEKEAQNSKSTKAGTRIELVKAENRKENEKLYNNMLKTRERSATLLEKLREYEAAYNAECEEVERLKRLPQEDKAVDTMDTLSLSQPPRNGTGTKNTSV